MIIDSPIISGSLASTGSLTQIGNVVITGSLNVSGPIKGNITGSADSASFATTSSYAFNAELLDGLDRTSFVYTSSYNVDSSSFSTRVTNTEATASSLVIASGSFSTRVTTLENASSSFAQQSGSNSTRLTNLETTASVLTTASASFAVVSSSFSTTSGSLSTRTTNLESTASVLTTASGSFAIVSSSFSTTSASLSTRTTNLESTASVLTTASASFAIVSQSFSSTSQSVSTRVTTIERNYATTGSNLFTGTQGINNTSNAISFTSTASLYLDGGARITRDLYVSGTSFFNNVTIYGTQSVNYITSSQLNIGTNIITVNTDTPTVRYGGIAVYDSGSTGLTGSLLWDSEANHWIYTNPSGSTYSGGMMISGPRSSARGCEQGTTSCALMMGQGGDHITSSAIFHYGNATCFYGNTTITSTGVGCFAGTVCAPSFISSGTICSTGNTCFGGMSVVASCLGVGTSTPQRNLDVFASSCNIPAASFGRNIAIGEWSGIGFGYEESGNSNYRKAALVFERTGAAAEGRIHILNNSAADISSATLADARLTIASTGIACFACQVCAPQFVGGTISGTTGTFSSNVVATGSLIVAPSSNVELQVQSTGLTIGNISTDIHNVTGSLRVSGSNTLFNVGCVGIGTTSPNYRLQINGPASDSAYLQITQADAGTANTDGLIIGLATGANPDAYIMQKENAPLIIQTNSAERLRITSTGISCFACQVCMPVLLASGCVGIGTTAPGSPLEIYSSNVFNTSTGANPHLIINYNSATAGGPAIKFSRVGISDWSAIQADLSGGTRTLKFIQTASGVASTQMVINANDGNVGIGTTSPCYKLDVSADINDGSIIRAVNLNSGAAATARFYAENNIGSLGQLTTYSSGFGFTVFGLAAGNYSALLSSGASSAGLLIGSLTSSPVVFGTNNTERMRIASTGQVCFACQVCVPMLLASGCVGIGTTSPTSPYRLDITGDFPAIFNVTSTANSATYGGFFIVRQTNTVNNGNGIAFGLYNSSNVNTEYGYIGALIESNPAAAPCGSIIFSPTCAGFRTERMRITSAGRVGIGVSTPARPLIIYGDPSSPAATSLALQTCTTGTAITDGFSIELSGTAAYVWNNENDILVFGTNNTERFRLAANGTACFACELTAKSLGTNDLILNNLNHEHANYVDGTRGSWLIQEGACDLFIINQVSCKKYKFNLIEIE